MREPTWQEARDARHNAVRDRLRRWAEARAKVYRDRDPLLLDALRAGLPVTEIHRLTGCSRSTIDRVAAAANVGPVSEG